MLQVDKHPYDVMGIAPGKEITVTLKCKVKSVFPKGTLGYGHGWVEVIPPILGLVGEQPMTVSVRSIEGYDPEDYR